MADDPLPSTEANAPAVVAEPTPAPKEEAPAQAQAGMQTAPQSNQLADTLKKQEESLRAKLKASSDARAAIAPKKVVPVTTGAQKPLRIVDLDAQTPAQLAQPGVEPKRFFIGEVGLLRLPNGKKFHVTRRHVETYDESLAEQLTLASKNPANKIFPETE